MAAPVLDVQARSDTGTVSPSLSIATTAGDLLVCCVAGKVTAITDSAANAWTQAISSAVNSAVALWYAVNAAAVSSINFTTSGTVVVNACAWKNMGAATLDRKASGTFSSSTSPSCPTITTTGATDLVFGALSVGAAASSVALNQAGSAPSSGWTELTDGGTSGSFILGAAYQVGGARGYDAAFTLGLAQSGDLLSVGFAQGASGAGAAAVGPDQAWAWQTLAGALGAG